MNNCSAILPVIQIFRFTEEVLVDYLIKFIHQSDRIFEFDETIGNKQLLVKKKYNIESLRSKYFKKAVTLK